MSSETKHTPVPWEVMQPNGVDRVLILGGPQRRYVCTVLIQQTPRHMGLHDEAEREANARLIAMAPKLLEALRELRELLQVADAYRVGPASEIPGAAETRQRIDAAIAKAEGK